MKRTVNITLALFSTINTFWWFKGRNCKTFLQTIFKWNLFYLYLKSVFCKRLNWSTYVSKLSQKLMRFLGKTSLRNHFQSSDNIIFIKMICLGIKFESLLDSEIGTWSQYIYLDSKLLYSGTFLSLLADHAQKSSVLKRHIN